VLVVDDDSLTRRLVQFILSDEGYDVSVAGSGDAAFAFLESTHVDVFILDVVMPRLDGFEVCRRLRELNPDAGILFLTGRIELDDRVSGLNVGADDYLTKPFEPSELIARVSALARRYQRQQQAPYTTQLRVGNVDLRVADLEVAITTRVGVERVSLTPTETKLLRHLMVNAGQVVSKRDLQTSIWGDGAVEGDSQAIAVYIRRLRRKLEADAANPRLIELVWGSGYRFSATD
jgi:DNA-binding response OmpR family regulator